MAIPSETIQRYDGVEGRDLTTSPQSLIRLWDKQEVLVRKEKVKHCFKLLFSPSAMRWTKSVGSGLFFFWWSQNCLTYRWRTCLLGWLEKQLLHSWSLLVTHP